MATSTARRWPQLEIHEVGVREFRDHVSRWLRVVRQGGDVVITDRNRPVARLIPAASPKPLDRLVAAGLVTPAKKRKGPLPRPARAKGSVTEILLRQRRESPR